MDDSQTPGANDETQAVKRQIEPGAFSSPRAAAPAGSEHDLHICPACASYLVYPLDWEQAADKRWSVWLRCPDCEWHGNGTYAQAAVDRFDETLDQGTDAILGDLRALARANLEERIDRFVAALAADRILPEDF